MDKATKKFIITKVTTPEEGRTTIFFNKEETHYSNGSTSFDGELSEE